MSRIHILRCSGNNVYQAVVHETTPNGNNTAGIPWSVAIKNAGLAVTIMTEGNNSGQITTAEKNNVENGSVIEGVFTFQDDPTQSVAARNAYLDSVANACIAELIARLQEQLKLFGYTRG